jgi:hypothetical protein
MANFSSVSCQEVHGTIRETGSWGAAPGASVDLRCAWADRHLLKNDLVGRLRVWPYGAGMYCTNAQIRPEAGQYTQDGQGMAYQFAIVTATYGMPTTSGGQTPDPSDPYSLWSEDISSAASFLTLDHKRFLWSNSDSVAQDEAPGWIKRTTTYHRTYYGLLYLPNNPLSYVGSVNQHTVRTRNFGDLDPGTLLFETPKISRKVNTEGTSGWDVDLTWLHNKDGWNKYWRATTEDYESIYLRDATGHLGTEFKPYPVMDFSAWLPS